jgi:hypothetical protein
VVFDLRGATPPEVTTRMIYQGLALFIGSQIMAMPLIWRFLTISTWLSKRLFLNVKGGRDAPLSCNLKVLAVDLGRHD